MRWYSLHPELPEKAVLRIRTAPNSSAAVCGRVSKGKAIAALAPEFEIDDDTLSLATSGSVGGAPQRWLHVSFPEELSGAPVEGYVMACLPNGMRLLVPWERADFINCCRIRNAGAKLFEGPLKTSAAVGLAEEGEGVKYPYGVAAVEGSRACILHDILDSVWIEIAELEPVCVQLRHLNCSTPHAFYTLNEDLPPEAQIAIRCFPSKDAETVGLLSRGEVIEVVAQCGNWLQVAATQDGEREGEEEDSWIMCQTDSWTLLVEFPDHSSGKCASHASFSDSVAEIDAAHPDQALPDESPYPLSFQDSDVLHQTEDISMATAKDSLYPTDLSVESAFAAMADDFSSRDEVESLNDQFRDQSSLHEADADMDGECVERDDFGENAELEVEERAVPVISWDERPLNVRSNPDTGESSSDKIEQDNQQKQYSSPEDDGSEIEPVAQHFASSESTAASWDDRPIRPQKAINWEESLPPAQNPDEIHLGDTEAEVQDDVAENEEDAADSAITQPHDEAESDESATTWNETPVGDGNPHLWDETAVEHSSTTGDEHVKSLHPDQAIVSVEEEKDAQYEGPTEAVSSWDETPVGGFSDRAWDKTPVGGSSDRSREEISVGGDSPRPWDEMPVGTQTHENRDSVEDVIPQPEPMSVDDMQDEDEAELLEVAAVVTHDETPVGGGNSGPWDETLLGTQIPLSAAGEYDVDVCPEPMTVVVSNEGDDDQVMRIETVPSWEETSVGGAGSTTRPWDETPVGGSSKSQVWDEFPAGYDSQSSGSAEIADENEETHADSMAVDSLAGESENGQLMQANPGSSWEEVSVSGVGRQVCDETPVGDGSKPRSWDEFPVGRRIESGGSCDADEVTEDMHADPLAVDTLGGGNEPEQPLQTNPGSSWSENSVGGRQLWDETPVGGGRKSCSWDEFPVGNHIESGGSGAADNETDGMSPDPMTADGLEEEDEQEQPLQINPGSSWDDTPVGGGGRQLWDETPVGGASSHPWEDMLVGARSPEGLQQGIDAEPIVPDTYTFAESPARSRLARMIESDLLSSVYSSASSAHVEVDHGQAEKLTLADLDEPTEAAPVWNEVAVGGNKFKSPLQSRGNTSEEFFNKAGRMDEYGDMANAETQDDELFKEAADEDWSQDTPSCPIMPPDVGASRPWEVIEADSVPILAEEAHLMMSAEDMIIDSAENEDHDSSQQVWDAAPVAPASHSHSEASTGFNGHIEDDEEEFYDSQDAEKHVSEQMEDKFDDKPTDFIEEALSVKKRDSVFAGNTTGRVENRLSVNGVSFAGRRTRKPEFSHSENASGGLSFLMEFGIRAYCRHKQILITSNEEVSRILFEAVVYGDDPEIILEALTADEPPCEEWMTFSPSKVRVVSSEPDFSHNFLDVLYARDSGNVLTTPKQLTPQQTQQLRTPPHSSGARKVKIDRMFNRTPVKQRPTPAYDLIMNNADVDKILEAEFGSEACELSILGPYIYPTLAGSRMIGKSSRSPVGDFSMGISSRNRFASAMQTTPTTGVVPDYALRTSEDVLPRASTPPAEEMTNPLKRAASAIAKTPPVHDAKTASAAPAVPAAAAQASARQSPAGLPPASRLGSRLSSTVSSLGASSALRRPPPQPTASEPAVSRSRASLPSASSTTATRSSITGTLPNPAGQSLLQRKSFLPTPSPLGKSVATPSTSRNSMARQIAQAIDTSSMTARRTSFGFVRPKTAVPAKK